MTIREARAIARGEREGTATAKRIRDAHARGARAGKLYAIASEAPREEMAECFALAEELARKPRSALEVAQERMEEGKPAVQVIAEFRAEQRADEQHTASANDRNAAKIRRKLFDYAKAVEISQRAEGHARQQVPRTPDRAKGQTREGHGRPRQANAPPRSSSSDDSGGGDPEPPSALPAPVERPHTSELVGVHG